MPKKENNNKLFEVVKGDMIVFGEDYHVWEHSECGRRIGSVGEPIECPYADCPNPTGGTWTLIS